MQEAQEFSVESAREAGERGELAAWVAQFLASPGSDNAVLADQLSRELHAWVGPVQLPLAQLHRLAGPPGHPVLCEVDQGYWDDRVDDMESAAEQGNVLPPVIVAYREGRLDLEDGNHRVEGLRQAGARMAWSVVGFEREADRDRFLDERRVAIHE